MEIKFLGTGGAFAYKLGSASATVQTDKHLFLIDCGPSIYPSLRENNLIENIDYILITHLHGDHVGGLFQLVVHLKHKLNTKLKIIYPTESFRDEIRKFLALNFQFDESVEYINITDVDGVEFIDTTGQHVPKMPTYAYYFTNGDELIYYSGDLGKLDTTMKFLESRNEKNIRVFHDINPVVGKGGHVYYKEASERLKDYEAYGYHCDKDTIPEDNTIELVQNHPELNY